MTFKNYFTIAAASALLLTVSCRNDDEVSTPKGDYENGIIITNEGNFGRKNAEISWVSSDFSSVKNDIYKTVNSEELGDVLQSASFSGDKAYFVVNNSNKVVVTNRYTLKKEKEISVNQPRYSTVVGNYLYVTSSSDGAVNVYKLSDYSIEKTINIGGTVENIVSVGKTVFVQNASYGYGNTLTLINTSDNTKSDKLITVPNGSIQKTISYSGNVYTIASTTTDSYIYKYDEAGNLLKTYTLTNIPNGKNLDIDQNKIYFSSQNKIYQMDINASTAPTTPIITAVDGGAWFTLYGMNVIDGKVYTVDVKGFTEASEITVYNTSGTKLKTFTAGMGTNGFYKN